jgi:hypothetical protein
MRLAALRGWLERARRSYDPLGTHGDAAAFGDADMPAGAAHDGAADGPASSQGAVSLPSAWSPTRIDIAESLWGEGCVWPGGADEILRMALPFGLSDATSLLLVGGGSGAALQLAGHLGVWVTACEADPGLAAAAGRRVQRAGVALAKRAMVQAWQPAAPVFRALRRFWRPWQRRSVRAARSR